MQSLADFLGTATPNTTTDERPPSLEGLTAQQFAEAVLHSPEFYRYVVSLLVLGEIPAPIVLRLMDYAWGKPVDRVEVKDTTPQLGELSAEQLEARALQLAQLARSIRGAQDEQSDEPQVH